MKGHGAKLPRKQEQAIAALLNEKSIDDAAKSINVSSSTLRRWMALPDFELAYQAARRAIVQQNHARIQQHSWAASIVLVKILADAAVRPAVRLRAAEIILTYSDKSLELDDMLRRLRILEGKLTGDDK